MKNKLILIGSIVLTTAFICCKSRRVGGVMAWKALLCSGIIYFEIRTTNMTLKTYKTILQIVFPKFQALCWSILHHNAPTYTTSIFKTWHFWFETILKIFRLSVTTEGIICLFCHIFHYSLSNCITFIDRFRNFMARQTLILIGIDFCLNFFRNPFKIKNDPKLFLLLVFVLFCT